MAIDLNPTQVGKMKRYTPEVLSLRDTLKRSLRLHYLTLKYTIFCILFITVTKYVSIWCASLFSNVILQFIIYVIATLIIFYFFAVALLATHCVFIDQPQSIRDTMKAIWHRRIPIYTTFIAYIAGAAIIYFLMSHLILSLDKMFHISPMIYAGLLIVMFTLFLIFVALFYFSFALSIIDEKNFQTAFYNSAILTEKNKMGLLMLFCILDATILLVTPKMVHEYFLSVYHLDVVFDFVVLCVAIPLYINLLLFLIHDTKQKVSVVD